MNGLCRFLCRSSLTPPALVGLCVFTAVAGEPAPGPQAGRTWRNPVDGMEFVWIPAGRLTFAPAPTNDVVFTNGFWLGRTEVTVAQFRRFVQATGHVTEPEQKTNRWNWRAPGFPQQDDHPVVWLAWSDARAYAQWAGVDLPGESEWLYAARAGATTRFHCGDELDDAFVWHRENASDGTRPVAAKPPNAWGLHDILGNAYEWCRLEPRYGETDETESAPRGGSWTRCPDRFAHDLPALGALRYSPTGYDDDRGFRCLRRTPHDSP